MIPVSNRASSIEYAIRDVVVPATKLESEGHKIIKLKHWRSYRLPWIANASTYG